MGIDEILSLGTQREVCKKNIGTSLEKKAGKFEVNAYCRLALGRRRGGGFMCVPEPAPVTMAVLPVIGGDI